MKLWTFKLLAIAGLIFSCSPVQAASPPACDAIGDNCSEPLGDITIITPGEFLVAKLHCYGCPTTEWSGSGPSRVHRITHEENALFYNLSISNSKTELLLNDVAIFPLIKSIGNTEQPPRIYTTQVSVNFNLSSLLATISCTQVPCRTYDGRCLCIPDFASLGSMGVDYEYMFSPTAQENAAERTSEDGRKWTLSFDPLGGYNGFMGDPFAAFDSPEQKVLFVEVQQDKQGMLSILGANLAVRGHLLEPVPPKSSWEKVWLFFGVREEMKEGHIVYRRDEWDAYGRTGTLNNLLKEIWYGWPWSLILIIAGSVIGGLTVLYAIYRFVTFVMDGEEALEVRNETWSRERGYYLEEARDEAGIGGLLAGDDDIDDETDNAKALLSAGAECHSP